MAKTIKQYAPETENAETSEPLLAGSPGRADSDNAIGGVARLSGTEGQMSETEACVFEMMQTACEQFGFEAEHIWVIE